MQGVRGGYTAPRMVIRRPQPLAPPCYIRALSCVRSTTLGATARSGARWSYVPWCVVGGRLPMRALIPSSRPPPTVVLLVLPVEPESSIVVVGFCVVRRYRVVVAIMLPCRAVLGADICRCRSEFRAPTIHPGAVARRAGGECSAIPCRRVVISHCGWA